MDNASKLLELAREKFGTVTKAEEKLFRSLANGKLADYSDKSGKDNDPAGAEKWADDRVLKAECITWLCTDAQASALVAHQGMLVKGARIDGILDLQFAKISFPLYFEKSNFPTGINLQYAKIHQLFLPATQTGPIIADSLKVEGSLFLSGGFKAEGEVALSGAIISGHFGCAEGRFTNKGASALNASGLKVKGQVLLCGSFKAEGEVRLLGATIGGDLDCDNGQFINEGGKALIADRLKVEGGIFLRNGFKAEGEVRLLGAIIGGNLSCKNGQFINKGAHAFNAYGLKVKGNVFLGNSFKAKGEICLVGATIGGDLDCDNGRFINKGGIALIADRSKVEGRVFLRNGFKAEGEVWLVGTTIGGDFTCIGGQFINKGGIALIVDRSNVEGSMFLRNGFKAEGEVRLLGATIGGDLDCDNGQFINKEGITLYADGLKVKDSVHLRNGFMSEGEVRLIGATIGGNLECDDGQFINSKAGTLTMDKLKVERSVYLRNGFHAEGRVSLHGAMIDGSFVWAGVISPEDVTLDLRSARIGVLMEDLDSWPESGRLLLNGLVYDEIGDGAPTDAKSRIDWLCRQPSFQPQPYEQLAEVLRKSGHDNDAKQILIAKNKDRARLAQLTWSEKCWYHFFGKLIGYGYRPWRAFWFILGFVALGWGLFGIGFRADVMTPTKEGAYVSVAGSERWKASEDYPKFNALVYSLDVFVPLIDLHQGKYWLPNANQDGVLRISEKFSLPISGGVLRGYLWFHIIVGWVLTTLLVVGLTGLIRT